MKPENFENHDLFEKLVQLDQRLNEDISKEKIDLDSLAFFQSTYHYISDRLRLTIPLLVQEPEMAALNNEIVSALQQINAFLGNNNIGHITNATNNFNSALTRIRNFPFPLSKGSFNFSRAVSNFQNTVRDKYSEISGINKNLLEEINNFQTDLKNKEDEIQRLSKLLLEKETEIQALNLNFQNEFKSVKEKANLEFESDRKTFRHEIDVDREGFSKEIDNLKHNINTDTSDLVQSLNQKLEEAKKIVNVVGNIGVTGNYQLIANEHKATANFWRWVAITFMAVFSGLLVWTILDLSSQGFNWTKSLLRLIAAAALSYPATYAAKESSKHRKLETINRTAELELASINPFIENLEEDRKRAIKEQLVNKYFGNEKSGLLDNDKESEEISIAGFERIVKALSSSINKQ